MHQKSPKEKVKESLAQALHAKNWDWNFIRGGDIAYPISK